MLIDHRLDSASKSADNVALHEGLYMMDTARPSRASGRLLLLLIRISSYQVTAARFRRRSISVDSYCSFLFSFPSRTYVSTGGKGSWARFAIIRYFAPTAFLFQLRVGRIENRTAYYCKHAKQSRRIGLFADAPSGTINHMAGGGAKTDVHVCPSPSVCSSWRHTLV